MPYQNNNELPDFIKKYKNEKIKSQWREVWNSVFERTHDESRAFAAANSVLRKRFDKKNSSELHSDVFNHMINVFLSRKVVLNGDTKSLHS